MKTAYFDCFSGISGDMTLGALLACAGADEARFREQLTALGVPGYELTIQTVKREGITATDVDVKLLETDQGHGRHLSDIAAILAQSRLSARVQAAGAGRVHAAGGRRGEDPRHEPGGNPLP